MRLTAQILTEDERHRIHTMSLRILEEVGIRFSWRKGSEDITAKWYKN